MPLPTRRPRVATSRNLLVLCRLAPFPRHPLYRRGRRAGSGGPGHPERSDRTRLGTALPRLSSERLPNPFSALPSVMIGAPGLPNCEFFRFLKQTHSASYIRLSKKAEPSITSHIMEVSYFSNAIFFYNNNNNNKCLCVANQRCVLVPPEVIVRPPLLVNAALRNRGKGGRPGFRSA